MKKNIQNIIENKNNNVKDEEMNLHLIKEGEDFLNKLNRKFPTYRNEDLNIGDLKNLIKKTFPDIKLSNGFIDVAEQKRILGKFYKKMEKKFQFIKVI